MKIKCIKLQCPICCENGSCQVFFNKQNEIKYGRVRHYTGLNEAKKPQFTYCKIEGLQQLETLLKTLDFPFPATETQTENLGHIGQDLKPLQYEIGQADSRLIFRIEGAGSSVRIEHHPPENPGNIDLNIDLTEYREYLLSKFSRSYALQMYNKALKYFDCYGNPQIISTVPSSIRGNVLKAMVNLAKYLGKYEEYKAKLKNYGVRWVNGDDSFNSFLRIVNNNHSNLGKWYKTTRSILRDNEKLWLRFNLLTGLRKQESINSFNLIIRLAQENKLSEHYNEDLGILEHFKYADLFLRQTKKVYISIVSRELVSEIAKSRKVNYSAIRKRLTRKKLNLRFKELRSYCATNLRTHGILPEYIDLVQGRIPKSVFARHYLKVEDAKELVMQVLAVTENLGNSALL